MAGKCVARETLSVVTIDLTGHLSQDRLGQRARVAADPGELTPASRESNCRRTLEPRHVPILVEFSSDRVEDADGSKPEPLVE